MTIVSSKALDPVGSENNANNDLSLHNVVDLRELIHTPTQRKKAPEAPVLSEKEKLKSEKILEDAQLIERIANGDSQAYNTLIEKTLKPIYTLAYRILKSESEAEDVTQEVYIKLWKIAHIWKPQAKAMTWLYHVTMNTALDRLRKRSVHPEVHLDMEQASENWLFHQVNDDLEQIELKTYRTKLLRSSLTKLPKRYRKVIELRYFQDMRVKNISEKLNISPRAAESLLKRAHVRLKRIFQEETQTKT